MLITTVTELRTPRLLLRPLREQDRQAMVDIHADPRTNRFNPDPPSVATFLDTFTAWLAHWAEHGFGYLAVTEPDGGEVLGLAGVRLREFHGERVLNLAYRFRPSAWGQGYAVEAAAAVMDWCTANLPGTAVLASVNVANKRSLRVVEKLGFTDWTEEMHEGAYTRHYRRSPEN